MQVSGLSATYYTPVQPAHPVPPVKREKDADGGPRGADKPKAATPPGIGSLLDVSA